jgi:type IV pilus assembly protein PilN
MLRINLLPIRQLKKRAKAKNQIAGFSVIFLCFVALLGLIAMFQANRIKTIEKNIAELTNEQKRLAPEIAAYDKLQKDKDELVRKISIIKQLKEESSLTVHMLDEVANVVDNSRMWLTSFIQQGNSLTLTGIALDNQTVAQFMDTLKKSPFVENVNLSNSSLKKISDRSLKEFSLSCAISQPKQVQESTKPDDKKIN